ncbi:peptidase A4 family-domain-containing protein, partial [Boletus edulis BED1]
PTSPSVLTLSMRLISALASSLLFVPIVLAEYDPEKHQPRSFNFPWAGASLGGNEGGYATVIGNFPVPLAWGDNSPGVAITVGIGMQCPDSNISFTVGIDVLSTKNYPVSYAGEFDIGTGDFMRASVTVYSATNGSALLENLSTGGIWWQSFTAEEHAVCQQSAEWAVTALADYSTNLSVMPVPKFSTVTFVNATAQTASGASAMAGGANITNIKFNSTMLTTAMAAENVVVVAREMY